MTLKERLRSFATLSIVGAMVGTLFLAASLSPSLLPRPTAGQGLLSGVAFAVGYGVGTALLAVWKMLHLPLAGPRLAHVLTMIGGALSAVVAIAFLWQASTWQNAIHEIMGMELSAALRPAIIGPVAALVFFALLTLARGFRHLFRFLARHLAVYVPRRVSHLVSLALSVIVFWTWINGILFSFLLNTADRSFQQLDALIEDDLPFPSRVKPTLAAESLVSWDSLGRQGRRFVAGGPDGQELEAFFGHPAQDPVRVYVGLNSAATPDARARLALEELKRVGGFDRSVLVLATPTGTGWIDPAGQDSLEYLFRGDVATVAVQYSYLNSPLALLTQAAYGAEASREVFREIYDHWRTLPKDKRPRLFLTGLSLGALNSDHSFDLFDIIDDPFHGVLWIGPPFRTQSWLRMTQDRDPGSPAWLPKFRDGKVVRFMNQTRGGEENYQAWGDFRILILQYASDPVAFFQFSSAWRAPEWMMEPRGPDVTADLRWFPIVTMLQLAVDMIMGTAPRGFGHEYAAADYIDAWFALAEPEGWTEPELERLRRLFAFTRKN